MQRYNRKFEKVITVLIALTIFAIGIRIGLSQSGQFLKSVVEPGSMISEASYVIFTDGTNYYARNGTTGEIEFSGTNASTVINNAIGNGSRKVVVVGNITITNTILVKAYTILDLSGANLTLATNANCNMINATGWDYKITGGTLDGNGNQQSSGSCIMINGGSQRFWIGGGMRIINAKQFGIYLLGSGPLVTQDIGAGTIDGVDIEDSGSHGILAATWSADNEYTNLNLGGNGGDGIALSSSGASIISDSFIWNNGRYGIDLAGANFNLIETCRVDSNTNNGIMMEYGSNNNTVLGNKIFLNNGTGIEIYDTPGYGPTAQNEITGNTLFGNAGGAILIGDTNNDISSNTGYNTDQQSYSYLVYTDGTTYYAKNGTTGQIDFQSTNASYVIQSAINTFTSKGGLIFIKAGNYVLSSSITIDNTIYPLDIEGEGDETILYSNVSNDYAIKRGGTSGVSKFHKISHLKVYLSPDALGGIHLTYGASYWDLEDLSIWGADSPTITQYGILIDSEGESIIGSVSGWNRIVNCRFYQLGESITLTTNANGEHITDPIIRTPRNIGINIDSGVDAEIYGARIEGVLGCTAIRVNSSYNNFYGIDIELSNTSTTGYNFTSFSSNNRVFGGRLNIAGTYIVNSGTDNRLIELTNYINENTGSATVSNNDWIAHGLATTPSVITITPRSNATVWVNNRNATHFQVGVSSGTVTVDWYAKV